MHKTPESVWPPSRCLGKHGKTSTVLLCNVCIVLQPRQTPMPPRPSVRFIFNGFFRRFSLYRLWIATIYDYCSCPTDGDGLLEIPTTNSVDTERLNFAKKFAPLFSVVTPQKRPNKHNSVSSTFLNISNFSK